MPKSTPIVHLTFSDDARRLFATVVSGSVSEDSRWAARCEAAGVLYRQGFSDEAVATLEYLRRAGYQQVDPDVLLGPEPLRRK